MKFDHSEWVNDIVTMTLTGIAGGAVGGIFVPDPAILDLMLAGGAIGLVSGLLTLPIKWILNRRPGAKEEDSQS